MKLVGVLPENFRPVKDSWASDLLHPETAISIQADGKVYISEETNPEIARVVVKRMHGSEWVELDVE